MFSQTQVQIETQTISVNRPVHFRLRFLPSSSMETDDMLDSTLNDETEQDFTDAEPRSCSRRAQPDCTHCQCHKSRSEQTGGKAKSSPKKIAKDLTNLNVDKRELENCSTEDTLDSGFVTSDLIGASNGHVISEGANHDTVDVVNTAVECHVLEDLGKSAKNVHYIPLDDTGGVPEVDNYTTDSNITGKITCNGESAAECGEQVNGYCRKGNINGHSRLNSVRNHRDSASEGDELCVKCDDDDNLNEPLPESCGSLIAPEDNLFILKDDLVLHCDSKTKGAKHNNPLMSTIDDDNKSSIENSPKQKCNRRIEFNLDNDNQTGDNIEFNLDKENQADDDKTDDYTSTRMTSNKSQLNDVCDNKPASFRPISLVIQSCDSIDKADCECNCHDNNRLQLPKPSVMHHRDVQHVLKESTGE